MKKFFSILLAIAVVASLSAVAFAESQEITVSYTAAEAYEMIIPSSQSFLADSLSSTDTISATALLSAGKILKVFLNSANNFALICGESSIAYSVSMGESTIENNACVLEVAAGSTSGSSTLTFATTADAIAAATVAGEHTDIITFSCNLDAAE